jgi:hypothetical protein
MAFMELYVPQQDVKVMGTQFFSVFSAILYSSLVFLFIYSPLHTYHGVETPVKLIVQKYVSFYGI